MANQTTEWRQCFSWFIPFGSLCRWVSSPPSPPKWWRAAAEWEATLIYSQRFFESPTVFAYIVVMWCIGLLLGWPMLSFQRHFLRCTED
jgi:hypothetical protein